MITPSAEIAITLELIPARMQLVEAVLSGAGLGSLFGSAIGIVRGWPGAKRAVIAERWMLTFGAGSFAVFVLVAAGQAVS